MFRSFICGVLSLVFFAGIACTQVLAVDRQRMDNAIYRLEQTIYKAKNDNGARRDIIYELESILYELRQARSVHGGGGAYPPAVPVAAPVNNYNNNSGGGFFNWDSNNDDGFDTRSRKVPDRRNWSVYGDLNPIANVHDKNRRTRADSGTANYRNYTITADLGRICDIRKVIQDHASSAEDYPERYKIDASQNGQDWFEVFSGRGAAGHSIASFPTKQARYVRIRALADGRKRQKYWSIHELGIE